MSVLRRCLLNLIGNLHFFASLAEQESRQIDHVRAREKLSPRKLNSSEVHEI